MGWEVQQMVTMYMYKGYIGGGRSVHEEQWCYWVTRKEWYSVVLLDLPLLLVRTSGFKQVCQGLATQFIRFREPKVVIKCFGVAIKKDDSPKWTG